MACPNCNNISPDQLKYRNVSWMFCGYTCIITYSQKHGGSVKVEPVPVLITRPSPVKFKPIKPLQQRNNNIIGCVIENYLISPISDYLFCTIT